MKISFKSQGAGWGIANKRNSTLYSRTEFEKFKYPLFFAAECDKYKTNSENVRTFNLISRLIYPQIDWMLTKNHDIEHLNVCFLYFAKNVSIFLKVCPQTRFAGSHLFSCL